MSIGFLIDKSFQGTAAASAFRSLAISRVFYQGKRSASTVPLTQPENAVQLDEIQQTGPIGLGDHPQGRLDHRLLRRQLRDRFDHVQLHFL